MKQTTQTCESCRKTFYAQRSTARFCSTKCRMAHHRASVEHEALMGKIAQTIGELGYALYEKKTSHEAAIQLNDLRHLIDMVLPPHTLWWHCDNCHNSAMLFLPRQDSCECGKKAKWFIMNTNSRL